MKEFTTPGNYTWQVPSSTDPNTSCDPKKVKVEVGGGGGGGGGCGGSWCWSESGSGGNGGLMSRVFYVMPGVAYVSVGGGGGLGINHHDDDSGGGGGGGGGAYVFANFLFSGGGGGGGAGGEDEGGYGGNGGTGGGGAGGGGGRSDDCKHGAVGGSGGFGGGGAGGNGEKMDFHASPGSLSTHINVGGNSTGSHCDNSTHTIGGNGGHITILGRGGGTNRGDYGGSKNGDDGKQGSDKNNISDNISLSVSPVHDRAQGGLNAYRRRCVERDENNNCIRTVDQDQTSGSDGFVYIYY